MIIREYKPNNLVNFSSKAKFEKNNISFSSAPSYKVINKNAFKQFVPILSFASSLISATGYFLGGAGLCYDLYHDKQKNIKPDEKTEGVKTIKANSKVAQIGMNCAKVAIASASIANIACGIGEGLPLMALGEIPAFASAKIIETPIGTGLFGIGMASIFAGLALDNTPNLKLNNLDLMAEKGFSNKSKLVLKNIYNAAKETVVSMADIIKNLFNPKFFKENFLDLTPKKVIFSEAINKDGKVIIDKVLRHNKNYLMNAASFVLTLGGLGIIVTSLLNAKKAQEASLKVEEGGFLFDNFGITKYGIDRLTTGSKTAGSSFIIGGIINAISQFVGLDNKDGRALQWLGIAGVFFGYSIDRGRHLKSELAKINARPELTRIVREWKIDLSELVKDKSGLKKLQSEIKHNKPITNEKFLKLEKILSEAIGQDKIKTKPQITETLQKGLTKDLGENIFSKIDILDVTDAKKAQEVLEICSEKIFGKNPVKIEEKVA